MEIKQLLRRLRANNIDVSLAGKNLRISSSTPVVPSDLLAEIEIHKTQIIEYLSKMVVANSDYKKLPKAPSHLNYPLSSSQLRLWILSQFKDGNRAYNMKAVWLLQGALDATLLEKAFIKLITRHEILRTIFRDDDRGEIRQWVKTPEEINFQLSCRSGVDIADQKDLIDEIIDIETEKPFDLVNGPLLRAMLLKTGEGNYLLIYAMHHIISDGWSLGVLVNELCVIYNSLIRHVEYSLPELEIQYKDYAVWQQAQLADTLEQHKDFWLKKFAGNLPMVEIPLDMPRPPKRSYRGDAITLTIDAELTSLLKSESKRSGATLFMSLATAVNILIYSYTQEEDIIIGSPVAGRVHAQLENQIGFYVNMLPLRLTCAGDLSFSELLMQVKDVALGAYEHQAFPFEQLVNSLSAGSNLSRNPLFDIMVILQGEAMHGSLVQKLAGVEMSRYGIAKHNTSRFDLTFDFTDNDEVLHLTLEYNADIYLKDTIHRLARHLKQIIHSVVRNPHTKISALQFMTLDERDQLLFGFNNTKAEFSRTHSLPGLFEEQVRQTPYRDAVSFQGKTISYNELNTSANRLAHYLRFNGVTDGMLVPLCLERGFNMITAILAIMKAGAAYVPIDPQYPAERINYIVADTKARVVISDSHALSKLCLNEEFLVVDLDHREEILEQPTDNLKPVSPFLLAYVIYTSGSTGVPKGVMNEHHGVVNRLQWAQRYFNVTEADVILQKTTFCFDVSVWELLLPLISGAKLVFAKPDGHRDSFYIRSIIEQEKVSMVHFAPSMLQSFSLETNEGDCPSLQHVICSGEALASAQVTMFASKLPEVQLHNLYGPTEAAIDVTYWTLPEKVSKVDTVPIGKPVSNTSIYVVDKHGKLSMPGGIGEICIGGVQVARGYLNLPELTREKFIDDPFSTVPGGRMYRTGDIGRWLPDGTVQYLSRVDGQVKIRGYRIEVGEIESVLNQSGLVSHSVVVAGSDGQGGKRLIAYIVCQGELEKEKITAYLRSKLPEYMMPSVFVKLETIPLTPNGKVDRKALPEVESQNMWRSAYEPARNERESSMVLIWQEILQVDHIGVNDNFFHLGGHSLLATRAISRVRRELQLDLSIKDLFEYPTIRELCLKSAGPHDNASGDFTSIVWENRPERIPLSYAQHRLWLIDQLGGSVHYHIPSVLTLLGDLNSSALEYALQSIIDRHEVLRTVIIDEEEGPYQHVLETGNWKLGFAHHNQEDIELAAFIGELVNKPFDLAKDHKLRADLIKKSEKEHLLIIVLHHIASDGWSIPIMVRELQTFYRAKVQGHAPDLKPVKLQYADYSIWQRRHLSEQVLSKKLLFWQETLKGLTPLNLPVDYKKGPVQTFRGSRLTFRLDKELAEKIYRLSREEEVTTFMTLLAGFNVLLYHYSGQEDICVGSPIANREHADIADSIGFFINVLVFRSNLSGNPSFTEFLRRTKETALNAYQNQDVPFEKIIEATITERDMSQSPLFQVMFALQNNAKPDFMLDGIKVLTDSVQHTTSKFDLSFYVTEDLHGFQVDIEYNTDIFNGSSIERMAGHYRTLLCSIVADKSSPINNLKVLTDIEFSQIVNEFNPANSAVSQAGSVVERFQETVKKKPHEIAVIFGEEQWTYRELDDLSNQLAHYLRKQGVKKSHLVPICCERGIQMVIGILGILKAGGAYVPIDPTHPQERIELILTDIESQVVLTSSQCRSKIFGAGQSTLLSLDEEYGTSTANIDSELLSGDLAYVIYTSGSTGKPKGVMVEHGNLISFLTALQKNINFKSGSSLLSVTTFSFDIFYLELFLPLVNGGKLIIASQDDSTDGYRLMGLLKKHLPKYMQATPSTWQILLYCGWKNDEGVEILVGGEALNNELKESLVERGDVWNLYGPTETTIWSTYKKLKPYESVTIGRPLDNSRVYVLSKTGQLCPVGIPGEIYIAGQGVARGYFNRSQLNSEKFLIDPFSTQPQARMYKTGDIGKWLDTGEIEYLGRTDHQVKIRGYRVELGEIEDALLQAGLMRQVVVAVQTDSNGVKRLIGYFVSADDVDREKITAFLRTKLPEYMVPTSFVRLDSLPLTANGKIDRKSLANLKIDVSPEGSYEGARNEVESAMVAIWKEVLNLPNIGIHDNFFSLGGDSVLSIQVVSRMRKVGYHVLPKDLFLYQSISELSLILQKRKQEACTGEQGLLSGPCGMLPIQQRYLRQDFGSQSHFNQSMLLFIRKDIGEADMKKAVNEIMRFHDSLRFEYHHTVDGWQQRYGKNEDAFRIHKVTSAGAELETEIKKISDFYQHDLNIADGQLVRVVLMLTPDSETHNRLLFVIHHLAIDSISWRILLQDLDTILSKQHIPDATLGIKGTSYRQWVDSLIKYGKSKSVESQADYWQKIIADAIPLPIDKPHNEILRMKDLALHRVRLSLGATQKLMQTVPQVYNADLSDALLSTLAKTICEWSGQNRIVIGLEGHGREDNMFEGFDLNRTIGWFSTQYPVLIDMKSYGDPGSILKAVKEKLRSIPDNGLGFGLLKTNDVFAAYEPWEVAFNYVRRIDKTKHKSSWFEVANEGSVKDTDEEYPVNQKINVNCFMEDEVLVVNWYYSIKHFETSTMVSVCNKYLENLETLIIHCEQQGKAGTQHTPSDYGLGSELTQEELDTFLQAKKAARKKDIMDF